VRILTFALYLKVISVVELEASIRTSVHPTTPSTAEVSIAAANRIISSQATMIKRAIHLQLMLGVVAAADVATTKTIGDVMNEVCVALSIIAT
jgi:hypothetical protein